MELFQRTLFRTYFLYFLSLFLIIIFLLFGCSEDGPTNPGNQNSLSDKISVGTGTQEITQDIGTGGGTIIISNTGSVLNGMELTVPENGYDETRSYTITSSPIIDHKLGEYFNPASPMITINNGGGYSEMPITIKVPINKNDDEFLMGFLFNEITGELEPLPIVALDDNFITVETRHFALSNITSSSALGKISAINPIANLIFSSINESVLAGQNVISSGFTPGRDDWEFLNYGSFISPDGHCAGQSITAMWYFYEKSLKGEPSLFHQFDLWNNKEKPQFLWQDNPRGYRFASSIQEDFVWDSWFSRFQQNVPPDILAWKTFIYAMLITGNPQFVSIKNTHDNKGHAMIVYKINITEGKLYVADPNYPNNRALDGTESIRTISFNGFNFNPYPSFAKVGDPGIEYDQITFFATNTFVDWTKIGERYKELEDGTIGSDRFKKYDLYVKTNTQNILFFEGMDMTESTLKLFCKNINIPGFLPGTDRLQRIEIFDTNGNYIAVSDANGLASVNLNSGENTFGIYICGYVNGKPNKYYDFKWVTVNYSGITPPDYNRCELQLFVNKLYEREDGSTFERETNEGFSASGEMLGNRFVADYNENSGMFVGTVEVVLDTITNTIAYADWTHEYTQSSPSSYHKTEIIAVDLPFVDQSNGIYKISGNQTCIDVTNYTYYQDFQGNVTTLQSFECNSDSYLEIRLYKE